MFISINFCNIIHIYKKYMKQINISLQFLVKLPTSVDFDFFPSFANFDLNDKHFIFLENVILEFWKIVRGQNFHKLKGDLFIY